MPQSFGLIDYNGTILHSSGDFAGAGNSGNFQLTFDRDVRNAVVVATHHRPFCDVVQADRPIQIGKRQDNPNIVCVFFADGGFNFLLMD